MRGRMRQIRRTLVAVAGGGLLLLGAAALMLYPQILKSAPEPDYPEPRDLAEANHQDIEFLGRLIEIDRSFSPEARQEFSAGIAELAMRAAELSPAELEMEAARLVALADNGHTNVVGVSHGATLNSLPIRINRFAEGYFITRARPGHADLLGARVDTIDGRAPEELVEALAPFVGGPPSLLRERAPYMMISPQALSAAGLADAQDRLNLTVTLETGDVISRGIVANDSPVSGAATDDPPLRVLQRRHWPQRDLSPGASPVDTGEWETLLDPHGPLPLYLRHPDREYWSEEIPELDALYVQVNVVQNAESGPTLMAFLNGVLDHVRRQPVSDVIIDLRFNPGGDGTITADFTSTLPSVLPENGRVTILTSGNTYSAAIITTARLKYFAGDRARIVGEPLGDREQFWAEGGRISLPNSGLRVSYATAMHDWEHGCTPSQVLTCYFINYIIGVPAGKLTPDLLVEPRFADYRRGEDSALLAIARGEPAPTIP